MKLQICDLCKQYDGRPVLDHVSMELESGPIYCLMAPSGSGKTTLFRILMGLETADSGRVVSSLRELRIGAVFQEDRLCEAFSAVDNVLITADASMSRETAKQELLELLPRETLNRPVSTLSGGQKRRVAICRALCALSDLLILDEPFTGLDAGTKNDVIRYLQKKSAGKLTLLSTHQEEDVSALGGSVITI